jgi:hypothetical protein
MAGASVALWPPRRTAILLSNGLHVGDKVAAVFDARVGWGSAA